MGETLQRNDEARRLKQGIEQLNAGDTSVRGELLNLACERLMCMTTRLRYCFADSGQIKSAEEVFENASLRLYQTLHETPIKDARHFYRLAATQIRRELIDLCRQCQSADSRLDGQRLASSSDLAEPPLTTAELRQWAHFHDSVDALPEVEREVFELIWYHEIPRDEVANLLGASVQEIRRLWRSARLQLYELLGETECPPGMGGA